MKVYRLDHEDGGGPFMTADGYSRTGGFHLDDGYLSCCLSLESLQNWFREHDDVDLSKCEVHIYEVPWEDIIKGTTHFYFPKKYKYKGED